MKSDRLKIFIIDDNKLFSFLLKTELEKILGDTVADLFLFEDGEACLPKLFLKPDLVIVDYHLNGLNSAAMDGIAVIELVRKESPETDFIMITIDEHTELFLRSRQHEIYDYLTKGPIVGYKLGLSIGRWLKTKK